MTDEFPRSIIFKLFVLSAILLLGSRIILADTYVSIANVTASTATLPSSPIPVTGHKRTDEEKLLPSADELVGAVDNLVEAPVKVIGPKELRAGTPEKVEEKRDNDIALEFRTSPRHLRNTCVLGDDIEIKRGAHNDETSRLSADDKNVEYDKDASGGSKTIDDEEEDDDENENENDGDVTDDEEVHHNLKRKAGRRYRQGPKIWDQWGEWTSCSVSCGAGKLTRWRHCVAGGCSLGNRRSPNPKIWDQWGGWSGCSATCGTGKSTRWRHCVAGSCVSGEKEAQIKSCNLERCS